MPSSFSSFIKITLSTYNVGSGKSSREDTNMTKLWSMSFRTQQNDDEVDKGT